MNLTARSRRPLFLAVFVTLFCASAQSPPLPAQVIPHAQDRPPGPPLSPAEALKKITVPEGFAVELFASEPELVNPTAMTFDEKGRVWVTESLEYPRRDAGPGKDRIKIFEDTDGDGRADRITVFAEGLNIPCGIAVGAGGAFVTNSPDILFLEDTDGDGRADRQEAVVTGFGRHDTHELPNTLTWGPDGWLYGLNGVFNAARVSAKGKRHDFDAALWRYHPRTRDFELFAEGTSNPWGVAFDSQGNAFVSACVIDHLFHLAETGYYHRQAGAYPPFTWKIESVVEHLHQKAAYCGLALYDAEAYPRKYRGRLFMGNIHGNCINVDALDRRGSTYLARGEPDFLSGNDVWFMPVSIKLAPDGCFYVLDWYDRYHCYQDANRDPAGIDRLKGRLYRIAYRGSPRAGKFDLAAAPADQLLGHLSSTNLWWRNESKRILSERIAAGAGGDLPGKLQSLILGEGASRNARLHALWTLISAEDPGNAPRHLDSAFHRQILAHADPVFRAWAVRAAGNLRKVDPEVAAAVAGLSADPSPDVRLQVATAARKLFDDPAALRLLLDTLAASEKDPLIPRIVWRNLEPLLETRSAELAAWIGSKEISKVPALEPLLGRMVERILARRDADPAPLAAFLEPILRGRKAAPRAAGACLAAAGKAALNRAADERTLAGLRGVLAKPVAEILGAGEGDPLYFTALSLAAAWREPSALEAARRQLLDAEAKPERRSRALEALAGAGEASLLEAARTILARAGKEKEELLRDLFAGLGKLDTPEVAPAVLTAFESLSPPLRPQALDLLAQRRTWAASLLDAVEKKRIDRAALNLNQVRRIMALEGGALAGEVTRVWGQVRSGRNPEREKVIARMRRALEEKPGDPWKGKEVFDKTCLQCHVLFGRGNTVGPDLTSNGRETLDALLTNLLDPNLVIGKDYYAWTALDASGRVLNGLLVESSPQQVVLKVAGGKDEVIPRAKVRSLQVSELSLMPEDLEQTLKEDELRDLISYLRYEEPPPEPVAVARLGEGGRRCLEAGAAYGELAVSALPPANRNLPEGGTPDRVEVLRYRHSGDGRPFVHPLRPPGGGPALTDLGADGRGGLFLAPGLAGGIDFWKDQGWVRSRGLESARELADRIEIISRSDWLSQRRGGKTILRERQALEVGCPDGKGVYRIDLRWELTPEEELTLDRSDRGGLALRPAPVADRAVLTGEGGHDFQDLSGRFGKGEGAVAAGVAIFDHPRNPGYPALFATEGENVLQPSITARGPVVLPAKKTTVFRYRLLVHRGPADRRRLEEEFRAWAGGP